MTYVKEGHGSVFRRVALSALIDTADRPSKKEQNVQTTRVIRYNAASRYLRKLHLNL